MKTTIIILMLSTSIAGFGLADDATKSEPKKQESFPAGNDTPVTAANANLAMQRELDNEPFHGIDNFFNLRGTFPGLKEVNTITGGKNERVIMTVHYYSPWSYAGYGADVTNAIWEK